MTRIAWTDGHPDPEWIDALHDGELATAESAPVVEHLATCPNCRERLASLEALSTLAPELDVMLPGPEFWGGLEERIMERVSDAVDSESVAAIAAPMRAAAMAMNVEDVDAEQTAAPSVRRPSPAWRWMVPMAAVFGVVLLSWRLLTSSPSLVGQIGAPSASPEHRVAESPRQAASPLADRGVAQQADRLESAVDAAREAPAAKENRATGPQAPKKAPEVAGSSAPDFSEKALGTLAQPEVPAPATESDTPLEESVRVDDRALSREKDALQGAAPPAAALRKGESPARQDVQMFHVPRPAAGTTRIEIEATDPMSLGAPPLTGDLDSLLVDDARRLAQGMSPDSLLTITEARAEQLQRLVLDNPTDRRLVQYALTAAQARATWLERLRPKFRDRRNETRIAELELLLKK